MIQTIFLVALCMSFFCLAMYIMMQEGHIFNWMRQPIIDRMESDKAQREAQIHEAKTLYTQAKQKSIAEGQSPEHRDIIKSLRDDEIKSIEEYWNQKLKSYNPLKPVVICPLCFASFWGSIVFFAANWYINFYPWNWWIVPVWIFTCSITVLFNAILNAICNKLEVY